MKRWSKLLFIREMQTETLWDMTTYRLDKIKRIDSVKCCKNMEKIELSYTASRNVKYCNNFWKQCVVSYKVKCAITVHPRNFTPSNLQKRNENTYSYKNLYVNVPNSFIHNSPKPETTQISINSWIDKQIVLYTYNGILFSDKREQTTDTITWMNLKKTLNERNQI